MTSQDTEAADITTTDYRAVISCFASGVAVVTSTSSDGTPAGTTVSALTSLSLTPPLLLACFDQTSLTLAAIRTYGAFAVNVLTAGQQHLSACFAGRGSPVTWDGIAYRLGLTGCPLLADVLATLECDVEDRFPGGDHEIVVGRVRQADTGGNGLRPLLYWRGNYPHMAEPTALPPAAGTAAATTVPARTQSRLGAIV